MPWVIPDTRIRNSATRVEFDFINGMRVESLIGCNVLNEKPHHK